MPPDVGSSTALAKGRRPGAPPRIAAESLRNVLLIMIVPPRTRRGASMTPRPGYRSRQGANSTHNGVSGKRERGLNQIVAVRRSRSLVLLGRYEARLLAV